MVPHVRFMNGLTLREYFSNECTEKKDSLNFVVVIGDSVSDESIDSFIED